MVPHHHAKGPLPPSKDSTSTTLKHIRLNSRALVASAWWRVVIPPDGKDCYTQRANDARLPTMQAAWDTLALTICNMSSMPLRVSFRPRVLGTPDASGRWRGPETTRAGCGSWWSIGRWGALFALGERLDYLTIDALNRDSQYTGGVMDTGWIAQGDEPKEQPELLLVHWAGIDPYGEAHGSM